MSKVICPICKKTFKEINNAHLNKHNLTVTEYDTLYPKSSRMTSEQRKKKARYQNLTPEMSQKLKRSKTLEGFKEKYGEEEGIKRWNQFCTRSSRSKTLERFKEIYGTEEGIKRYNDFIKVNKEKMKLTNFIKKYGKIEGTQKYNKHKENVKKSKTKEYYIMKYGTKCGTKKWNLKNNRNSLSSMKIPPELQNEWSLYKLIVSHMTKQTIRENNIPNISKIKKGKYATDHKFSVLEGFKNRIPPYIISSVHNLEVITHKDNCSKQDHCSLSLVELFDLYFNKI